MISSVISTSQQLALTQSAPHMSAISEVNTKFDEHKVTGKVVKKQDLLTNDH